MLLAVLFQCANLNKVRENARVQTVVVWFCIGESAEIKRTQLYHNRLDSPMLSRAGVNPFDVWAQRNECL